MNGDPHAPIDAHVYVASFNTAAATELCIRSARRLAGMPFRLTVGDGGSSDGSVAMLERMAAEGRCEIELVTGGRRHSEWLDHWFAQCGERYCVFSDSDVEYLGKDWLARMVRTARERDAALVATRIQAREGVAYRHPTTGATRTLASRPEPWLMLIDVTQTRGRVDATFGYEDRLRDDGTKTAFDIGAAFFHALDDAGLRWVEMPADFAKAYRHFGGLSWQRATGTGIPLRRRAKQLAKILYVRARLARVRVLDRVRPVRSVS